MSEYFDCTIKAGYYRLFGGPVGEHTFAIAEQAGTTYAFPCFGGFALKENERGQVGVIYPATLWTPYMIFSRPVGTSLPANLSVAMGMARWNIDPQYDYRVEDWDNWWNSLPEQLRGLSPSCNAGLTYAVTGVCQQACNRILWSTQQGSFTYTPVNWPPSFSATYWVYGYYGKLTEDSAIQMATQLVEQAKRRCNRILYGAEKAGMAAEKPAVAEKPAAADKAEQAALKAASQAAREAALNQTRAALTKAVPAKARQQEVQKMLKAAPGKKSVVDAKQLAGLLGPDEKFHKLKLELDKQLLRGEVSHDEYAKRVNQAFGQMLTEFRNVLPPDTFKQLFRDVPAEGSVEIIVRQQMPESYAPIQEKLRI